MSLSLTDTLLLSRVVRGDPAAIDACIERFGPVVWALARKLGRDMTDAEDATQEIFLDLWKSADGFLPEVATEASFVTELARRRLVDRRLRDRWHPMLEPLEEPEEQDVALALADVLATLQPLPESLTLRIAEDARVHFGRPILGNGLVVPKRVTITERPPRPDIPVPEGLRLPPPPALMPIAPVRITPLRPAPLPVAPLGPLRLTPPRPPPPSFASDILRGAGVGIAVAGWALAFWSLLVPADSAPELPSPAAIASAAPTPPVPPAATPSALPAWQRLSPRELAAQRSDLLAKSGTLRLSWSDSHDPAATHAAGDIVWSDTAQTGILRVHDLAANDPKQLQYQLWIIDPARDPSFPVDGGVFDIRTDRGDPHTGDILVPILPKLPVHQPARFFLTAEKPGGVVVSKRDRIVLDTGARD